MSNRHLFLGELVATTIGALCSATLIRTTFRINPSMRIVDRPGRFVIAVGCGTLMEMASRHAFPTSVPSTRIASALARGLVMGAIIAA